MNKQFLKDALGWGVALWLIGYILGFIFFAFVPPAAIGWYIMPIGTLITLWVLMKKISYPTLNGYLQISVAWTLIAIIFDYFFLVKTLNPADGYYKLDVYLYYILTFLLPLLAGQYKLKHAK